MGFDIINILKLEAICIGVFIYIVELPRNKISGPENVCFKF